MKKTYNYGEKDRLENIKEFFKTKGYGHEFDRQTRFNVFWDSIGCSISPEELSKHDKYRYEKHKEDIRGAVIFESLWIFTGDS